MKRYAKLYKVFFSQYIKRLLQSELDFVFGAFGFLMKQFVGIVFLSVVFQRIPNLNGWSFWELVFIYGFAQIPRGLDHFLLDFMWRMSRDIIRDGSFDRYLLRPVDPVFQLSAEYIHIDGVGEVLIGAILVILAAGKTGIRTTVSGVLLFLIAVIAGTLIFSSLKLICASVAFFISNSYELLYLVHNMSDYGEYPVSIYSSVIRVIISYIIPFALTAFFPASYFLGRDLLLHSIGVEVLVSAVLCVVSYRFFLFGCSKYQSAGN